MKIISWNTNGLRATVKQGNFIPLFAFNNPDIVCLQETKCEPDQLDENTRNLKGYNSYFSHSKNKKGYSGVAIYSKIKPKKVTGLGITKFDDEGRTLVAYYKDFVLINCYFPNGGGGPERLKYKLDFYDAFLKFIEKLRKNKYKIIFCGDVNTAHEEIDLARPKENSENTGFLPVEREWLDEVIAHGYVDTFRHFYPTKKDVYTYWDQKTRARDRNVGWRIDYFFVSPSLVKNLKKSTVLSDYSGSDHCPILLEIKLS
ncbi:MAG: exodeoxyribonuclease III [Patescibacteria group bacterium]|nr:exodeoxyribonuclease III [Patescibacteria group bacterium]